MYLDYAEDQARRRCVIYMRDWREKLDAFLQFNEREILLNPGKIKMEVAQRLALDQYDTFNQRRLVEEAECENDEFEEEARRIEQRIQAKKISPEKKRIFDS